MASSVPVEILELAASEKGKELLALLIPHVADVLKGDNEAARDQACGDALDANDHKTVTEYPMEFLDLLSNLAVMAEEMANERGEAQLRPVALSPTAKSGFDAMVAALSGIQPEIESSLRYRNAIRGLLPMLEESLITVDARVIWDSETGQPAQLAPVASFFLAFDSSSLRSIQFQASELTVKTLIRILEDAVERMESVPRNL